jgi:NAD-dependent deacetylase
MQHKHHIVFLTGAGISQESGISTFRDANGLWNNHKIEEVATPEGFEENPQLVLDFYNARRRQLDEVEPNQAHHLIAQLENKYKVTVITQNIDDLHERAGSTNVLHLHGELRKCRSNSNHDLIYNCNQDMDMQIKKGV